MEDYQGADKGTTIIDAGTGRVEGGAGSSQTQGTVQTERTQVIDLSDNQIRGGEASYQAQQAARQAVDLAQAGGLESEVAALQKLDVDLREMRREAALKAREADQTTAKNLETPARQPTPQVKKGWFSR